MTDHGSNPLPQVHTTTPLEPIVFFTLLVIELERKKGWQALHGSGIYARLESWNMYLILPSVAAFYRLLNRLESDGLIVVSDWRPDGLVDSLKRVYYHLTDLGKVRLAEESHRVVALGEHIVAIQERLQFDDREAEQSGIGDHHDVDSNLISRHTG